MQPAQAALNSLHSACLPIAASAAARAAQPAPVQRRDEAPSHSADVDVMAALLAGEQKLGGLQQRPAESGPDAVHSPQADMWHASIAEVAVNVGAGIINSALSQVQYPLSVC